MAKTVYEREMRSAELAIIISYPTRASAIIVLLKTPQKITRTLTIYVKHGIMAHSP